MATVAMNPMSDSRNPTDVPHRSASSCAPRQARPWLWFHTSSTPSRSRNRQPSEAESHADTSRGPCPVELRRESLIESPRNDGRMKFGLPVRRRPQEPATARRTGPLVEVRGVPVHAERGEIDRQHTRRVRGIHENRDATVAADAHKFRHWKNKRALRRDVIENRHACARGQRIPDRVHESLGI